MTTTLEHCITMVCLVAMVSLPSSLGFGVRHRLHPKIPVPITGPRWERPIVSSPSHAAKFFPGTRPHLVCHTALHVKHHSDSFEDDGFRLRDYDTARNDLRRAVRKCPIFQNFDSEDLDQCLDKMVRLNLESGQKIIKQGDTSSDAMYFVESGELDCVDEHTSRTVNVLKSEDYFGELALLFHQPRAVTVQVANEKGACTVWKLSRDDFNNAVQNYPLRRAALQAMKDKYKTNTLWKTFQVMSPSEIRQFLLVASRPKRKSVSFHSTLSTMVAGMFILIQAIQCKPGWDPRTGTFQVIRMHDLSDTAAIIYHILSGLFTLTAISGVFRIPENAPRSRRLAFEYLASSSISVWVFGEANLYGQAIEACRYLINAWSWFGRFSILGSLAVNILAARRVLVDGIAGSRQGKDTLAFGRSRLLFVLATTSMFGMLWVNSHIAALMFCDQNDVIAASCTSVIDLGGSLACNANALLGFSALVATLQLQKRVSMMGGTVLTAFIWIALLYDQLRYFNTRVITSLGASILDLSMDAAKRIHLTPFFVSVYLASVAGALYQKYRQSKAAT